MTKNVYYSEDNKQSFYIICKGTIDEGAKPFSFSKRLKGMRYLFACRSVVTSSVAYHVEVVEGDANSCKIGKYR